MKEYRISPSFYNVHITASNILMALVCVACAFIALTRANLRALFILLAVVALYSAWNAFVALANPSKVEIGPEGVAFSAYGRRHFYPREKLTGFRVREVGGVDKMFIRVNRPGLLHGRYWVDVFYFNDAPELAQAFLKLEDEIHPDSIKAVARSGRPLQATKKKKK